MKALVTGGAGLIGWHLVKKLLDQNYEVVSVDNLITGSEENIKPFLSLKNFTFMKADVAKTAFLREISRLGDFDEIYHLACPTGVPNLQILGEEMLLTCSRGTMNVLELAKRMDAKVLFTSSSEVYGDPEISPQSEEYSGNVDPVGARSTYEEGKRFAETLCVLYQKKYNLPIKIVRLFNTYGPTKSKDTRVISQFVRQALVGEPITIYGSGRQTRTFCYVDEAVDGLILIMKKGGNGEVYNLGSDKEITISDIARIILKITKSKSKIEFKPQPFPDHQRRKADITKIKKLGWRQKISLEEGLRRLIH